MNSNQWMDILETVGIPAAFAVAAGWMVYKLVFYVCQQSKH